MATMLETPVETTPVVNTEPVQAAPQVQPLGDAFEGAAERLFPNDVPKPAAMVDDLKPGETPPAPIPVDETPEAKAAREAAAKPAETPEEKAAREAAETPEQKTAREAKEAEAKKAEGAPEVYTDFTLPDGVKVDPEIDTEFKTLAKEANLPQAVAQKVIDLQLKANAKAATAAAEANQTMRTDWQNQVKTDKEFGGDRLNQSLATAQKAIKQFGDPALNELMAAGLGDHPAFIRFAIKVGAAVSEASIVTGAKPAHSTPESVLYPTLK